MLKIAPYLLDQPSSVTFSDITVVLLFLKTISSKGDCNVVWKMKLASVIFFVEQKVPEHLILKKKRERLCVIVYWPEFSTDRKKSYKTNNLMLILLLSSSTFSL